MPLTSKMIRGALAGLSFGMVAFGALSTQAADPVRLVGFDSLPMSAIVDGNKLTGPGYEFVADLFKSAGVPFVAEGQSPLRIAESLDAGNTVAVYFIRTPDRETRFTWIGGLIEDDGFAFITLSRNPKIDSFDQAKSLKSIGVISSDAVKNILIGQGITALDPSPSSVQNAKKLLAGRFDAWFSTINVARYWIKQEGAEANTITVGKTLVPAAGWITASKSLPAETVTKLQTALAAAKADGRYAAFRAQIN